MRERGPHPSGRKPSISTADLTTQVPRPVNVPADRIVDFNVYGPPDIEWACRRLSTATTG